MNSNNNSLDMGSYESLATPKVEVIEADAEVLTNIDQIKTLTDELVGNYRVMVETRGGQFDITEEDLLKFFITAMYYRVEYVRSKSHSYKSFVQYENHPHILGILVANIGKAYDEETGISLTPIVNLKEVENYLLNESDFRNIGRKFLGLRSFGISTGSEFPSDKKGDFFTMSFAFINGDVKREDRRAHPTQALVAAIAGVNLANSIVTPRITYISSDRINVLIRAAAQFEVPQNKS